MSGQMGNPGGSKDNDEDPEVNKFYTEWLSGKYDEMFKKVEYEIFKNVRKTVCKAFAYEGFNAKTTRDRIMTSGIQARDISYLVYTGMTQGNKISKILTTMRNVKSREHFLKIIRKLGISERVIPGKSSITLSRLIICFPDLACKLATNPNMPSPIPMEVLKMQIGIETEDRFPLLARVQGVSALIPAQLSRNDKLTVFTLVTVCHLIISDKLRKKNPEWMEKSPKEKLVKSLTYTKLAYTSKLIENDRKVELSLTLKIITKSSGTETLELVDEWHEPLTACEMFLKHNYDAEYKRVMISMLNLAED